MQFALRLLFEWLPTSRTLPGVAALTLLLTAMPSDLVAIDARSWEISPYRVRLQVAVDATSRSPTQLTDEIATSLDQQIRATIFPLWTLAIEKPTGSERTRLLNHLDKLDEDERPAIADRFDKLLYLTVKDRPDGLVLSCREFDCTIGRWTPVQQRVVRQQIMLLPECFDLICRTFAPLARIQVLEDNDDQVKLVFKGSQLPTQTTEELFVREADVFLPVMVRLNPRGGDTTARQVSELPWTYLTAEEQDGAAWMTNIHSGNRRPFGMRMRGRVEQIAIAMRYPPDVTRVRFRASHDESLGLAGYEVFWQAPGSASTHPIGLTDLHGVVEVPPGEFPVTYLFLRSESLLLAKVPVVPGAIDFVEIPVSDDAARLRAQEELDSLKERLIDIVARRNILIARVRNELEQGNLDRAQQLMRELDSLPTRANFDQLLSTAESHRSNRSQNPRVQAKIEKLFGDTRQLLGRFLNIREITELEAEVNQARSTAAN